MPARVRTTQTPPLPGIKRNDQQSAGNRLIDALPPSARARMLAVGTSVPIPDLRVLHEPGGAMRHAWFPLTGCILLSRTSRDSRPHGANLVGNEGMVGAALVLGIKESSRRAQVRYPGIAFRISASALRRELRRDDAVRQILNRYIYVLMLQSEQRQTCAHAHKIAQRLACLLLMLHDRAAHEQLELTQATLAQMLGVRRVGISEAAGALQRSGFIRYSRGRLDVTDRAGLEHAACVCYRVARDNHRRWIG